MSLTHQQRSQTYDEVKWKKGSLIFSLNLTFSHYSFFFLITPVTLSHFFLPSFSFALCSHFSMDFGIIRSSFFFQFFFPLSYAQKSSVDKYDNIIPSYPNPQFFIPSISFIVFVYFIFPCCWFPSIIAGQHKNEIVLKM